MSKEKPTPAEVEAPKLKIWELIKAIEEDKENWQQRYAEAKATMQVNFGDNARQDRFRNIVSDDDNLTLMLIKVFEYFVDNWEPINAEQSLSDAREAEAWVKVEDSNPKENGNYLVITISGHIIAIPYDVNTGWFNKTNATYWMPLPDLPKELNQLNYENRN